MTELELALRTGTTADYGEPSLQTGLEPEHALQDGRGCRVRSVIRVGQGVAFIHRVVQTGAWHCTGQVPSGCTGVLMVMRSPGARFSAQGVVLTSIQSIIYGPEAKHFSHSQGRVELAWVIIPLKTLSEFWPVFSETAFRISVGTCRLVTPAREQGKALRAAIAACTARNNGAGPGRPVQAAPGRTVRNLLRAYIEIASASGTEPASHSAQQQVVARGLAYIEDRLAQPLYMSELCDACLSGERVLQQAFKALLDVSPMRYVKLRRLEAARRVLLAGDRRSMSVKKAALDAGFRDLGRFATEYGRVFGERPSATLSGVSRRVRTRGAPAVPTRPDGICIV